MSEVRLSMIRATLKSWHSRAMHVVVKGVDVCTGSQMGKGWNATSTVTIAKKRKKRHIFKNTKKQKFP